MRNVQPQAFTVAMLAGCVVLVLAGCDQGTPAPSGESDETMLQSATLPSGLLLAEAPTGAKTVAELKESAKDGDQVVMHVVVGGREKPIVDNRAVMTVVDAAMKNQCTLPGDSCTTPWDYCCASPKQLKPNLATVQIVNDDGDPLAIDLAKVSGIKPLAVLVVKGEVGPRPDPGTLIVNATGFFVEITP